MSNNFVLLDTTTGLIRDYFRRDDEPVEGLDPRYEVLRIVRETAPQYDPATHSRSETRTIDRDAGEWRWGWSAEPLPPVPPVPDWRTFKRTLLAHPAIRTLLSGAMSEDLTAALSLPTTLLLTAATNAADPDDFRGAWVALRRQGLVPPELLQEVRGLALMLHLPEAFVAALGGSVRPAATALGQEWVDAAGDLWVVVQARGEDGQFLADDPSTPERESLAWEKQA
jgi:hypothetical protein